MQVKFLVTSTFTSENWRLLTVTEVFYHRSLDKPSQWTRVTAAAASSDSVIAELLEAVLISSLSCSPHIFTSCLKHRQTVRQVPVMFHSEFLELLTSKYFSRASFELHLSKGTIPHHALCTTTSQTTQTVTQPV